MKNGIILAAFMAALCASAETVKTATQPWVTNRIAEAEARVGAQIVSATNAIPRVDLTPATNYADRALGRFAATGTVARATYATSAESSGYAGGATSAIWAARISNGGSVGADNLTYSDILGGFDASSNYTDAVAREFSDGTRTAGYSDTSGSASTAGSLIGDGNTYNAGDLFREATNAAVAVADAKISTNNAAFVAAVLAAPIAGADAGDLAEIAEYGGYGTVGAALLALIAGLAALKRRVTSAETSLAQKANTADLPYAMVTPGEWTFSDGVDRTLSISEVSENIWVYYYTISGNDVYSQEQFATQLEARSALSLTFEDSGLTATRPSLPGHLLDRAGNRVVVSGDTTLTLPALEHVGRLRDFLVRLEISGSTVPTITFAAPTGETITYETDGDEFPVPDEAGTWSYSFTENCAAHKFAVSLKKVNAVAAPQTQGGS